MAEQDYSNHRRYVPMFHGVLLALLMATMIGSLVNVVMAIGDHHRLFNATLIAVLAACSLLMVRFVREFPLKVQDRAIRAEENLRHFVLTGKLLDSRLGLRQIIALRFAADEEFVDLARRAADEGLTEDQIKRAVQHWRPDNDRA